MAHAEVLIRGGKNKKFDPVGRFINIETEVVSPAICYEISNKAHCEFAKRNRATLYIASVLSSINGIDDDMKKLNLSVSGAFGYVISDKVEVYLRYDQGISGI